MAAKSNIDKSATRAFYLEIKKKNALEFIKEFQINHRVWMQELADAYKKRKMFGIHLFGLADFYTDPADKEVALLASLFLSEGENLLIQQQDLYNILGHKPYTDFLCKRGFVELSRGNVQNKCITKSFSFYYKISDFFQKVYDIHQEFGSVEDAFYDTLRRNRYFNPFMALVNLLSLSNLHSSQYKVNLLLMLLTTNDGIGLGLWDFENKGILNKKLLCPENRAIIDFLEIWFPDYIQCGLTFDKAVDAMGLSQQTDFYYAYKGFEILKKSNTSEVVSYCRRYQKRYNTRNNTRPYILRKLQPKIFFD